MRKQRDSFGHLIRYHSAFTSLECQLKLRESSEKFFKAKEKARNMVEKALYRWKYS
jgi:hypothetical protein